MNDIEVRGLDNFRLHGNYIGPNWTNGQFLPSTEVDFNGTLVDPIDNFDKTGLHHDRGYSRGDYLNSDLKFTIDNLNPTNPLSYKRILSGLGIGGQYILRKVGILEKENPKLIKKYLKSIIPDIEEMTTNLTKNQKKKLQRKLESLSPNELMIQGPKPKGSGPTRPINTSNIRKSDRLSGYQGKLLQQIGMKPKFGNVHELPRNHEVRIDPMSGPPVIVGHNKDTFKTKFDINGKSLMKPTIIKGRQLGINVTVPTTGKVVGDPLITPFNLSPQYFSNGRIKTLSSLWEKYKFTKLRVKYITQLPSSQGGQCVMYIDYDPDDSDPTGLDNVYQSTNSMTSQMMSVWENYSMDMNTKIGNKEFYTSQGEDDRLEIQGVLKVVSNSIFPPSSSPLVLGTIEIEYEIKFYGSELQPQGGSSPYGEGYGVFTEPGSSSLTQKGIYTVPMTIIDDPQDLRLGFNLDTGVWFMSSYWLWSGVGSPFTGQQNWNFYGDGLNYNQPESEFKSFDETSKTSHYSYMTVIQQQDKDVPNLIISLQGFVNNSYGSNWGVRYMKITNSLQEYNDKYGKDSEDLIEKLSSKNKKNLLSNKVSQLEKQLKDDRERTERLDRLLTEMESNMKLNTNIITPPYKNNHTPSPLPQTHKK